MHIHIHTSERNFVIFEANQNSTICSLKRLYKFLKILQVVEVQLSASVSLHRILRFQRADGAYCPYWV